MDKPLPLLIALVSAVLLLKALPGRVQPNFNDVMPIVASLRPLPSQHLPRHEVM